MWQQIDINRVIKPSLPDWGAYNWIEIYDEPETIVNDI